MAATASAHNLDPNGWHTGERQAHALLHVQTSRRRNPTAPGLPPSYGMRIAASPLVALGTVDVDGRPWTTLWGGEAGFARPLGGPASQQKNILALQSLVAVRWDPVLEVLMQKETVRQPVERVMVSGLAIDLETRDRVKIAGRMVVGAVAEEGPGDDENVREVQLAVAVEESLGNCPKYVNSKEIRPRVPGGVKGWVVGENKKWDGEMVRVVERADMFFLSTTDGKTMDTNHRGGPRGFVRVSRNEDGEEGGVVLVYPEYSGNQLYQSLGNLQVDRRIGVIIPDFETADAVYLTGETEVLVGDKAGAVMPHAKVAVKITVAEARFVKGGLPFTGEPGEMSPYNPPVRKVVTEGEMVGISGAKGGGITAKLVNREVLTPTIARYTFSLDVDNAKKEKLWKAGFAATLDFSGELDHGWSHMRDDDPQSLNDDFIRTFTVSSPPPSAPSEDEMMTIKNGTEMQITARLHGPVTNFLFRYPLQHRHQVPPLEIPVLTFWDDHFRMLDEAAAGERKDLVYVAGGVGVTPLLAQAGGVLAAAAPAGRKLTVLWSLRAEDVPLAVDSFARIPGLAAVTRLFVTGMGGGEQEVRVLEDVETLGAGVVRGRMTRDSVLAAGGDGSTYFVCTGRGMADEVLKWLEGQKTVVGSFDY
ncbi:putative oxidoreductase [Echria macrotheca]|uniref:Oxidoreductase n=1 Tax=Echria macrotheca TaxID=438768 RepID=A0AAJ0BKF3_9PEZI|nr:putative oxidoreductase [Echria macrotheca]